MSSGRTPNPGSGDAAHNGQGVSGKQAAQLAATIKQSLSTAGWPIGQSLGSEADLMEQHDVGRAVLREALRILEHQGVAVMRPGRRGGLVTGAPDPSAAVFAVALYLRDTDITLDELISVRRSFECFAAALAAQRTEEEGVERLRAAARYEMPHSVRPDDDTTDDLFHWTVAELGGNPALELFIEVLSHLSYSYIEGALGGDDELRSAVVTEAHSAHAAIADAIVAGDAAAAEHLMAEHIDDTTSRLRGRQTVDLRAAMPRSSAGSGKRAARVSEWILEDIWRNEIPVGQSIGTEPELVERYGVSRAVLREAIRLLEHHGAAVMRTGRHGGLIVAQPAEVSSVEAMSLCIEYRGFDNQALSEVTELIELACVERTIARASNPEVRDALTNALARERDPATAESSILGDVHDLLAVLSGSPILHLFHRVLRALVDDLMHTVELELPPDVLRQIAAAHVGLLEAILESDVPLAQRRLRRHLEAAGSPTWDVPLSVCVIN